MTLEKKLLVLQAKVTPNNALVFCSSLRSRHLLLSGGPVFTEDLWLIVSEGLREAVHTTLSNLRDMVACFQPGSFSVNGDEGMTVRVVARRDVITADMIRLQQVAEQVGYRRLKIPLIIRMNASSTISKAFNFKVYHNENKSSFLEYVAKQ